MSPQETMNLLTEESRSLRSASYAKKFFIFLLILGVTALLKVQAASKLDELHKERLNDGPVSPHDGSEHEFDHEAILGKLKNS